MHWSVYALPVLLPFVSTAAAAQQQPAYASAEDLAQNARCSVLKFVIDSRKRGAPIETVAGEVTFAKIINAKVTVEAGAAVTLGVIEISPSGQLERGSTSTTTETVSLSVDVNQKALPPACEKLAVRTLDTKGRRSAAIIGYLFTADTVPMFVETTSGLLNKKTISQTFTKTTGGGGGFQLNLFGLLKLGKNAEASTTQTNGFEVTFGFKVPPANRAGVRFGPEPKKR